MKASIPSDVKRLNQQAVLNYIYQQRATTQPSIREALNLSRPTIIQIIKEFEEQSLLIKDGFVESTGGRKATKLTFNKDCRVALGVELLASGYEIVTLNLYGETIHSQKTALPFKHHDDYYASVCKSILDYIEYYSVPPDAILGIGIVLQGLISSDGSQVTYGKILGCTGLNISTFTQHLPYPCQLFHDAESAALDELWQSPSLKDAIYVHIRTNMSGAIIVDREFLEGIELKSGVFEHMTIVPNGKPCYCGNKGCLDTYCSTTALLSSEETLDVFFEKLRSGDDFSRGRWQQYLQFLAIAINNLHMFIDCDIILGGLLSPYLQGSDLTALHNYIYNNTAFPAEREFIKVSRCPSSPISRGPALYYIKNYLNELIGL